MSNRHRTSYCFDVCLFGTAKEEAEAVAWSTSKELSSYYYLYAQKILVLDTTPSCAVISTIYLFFETLSVFVVMTQPTHFIHGALATCGAATISNPMEVCKTRLQLQGELNASKRNPHYNGPISTFKHIFKHEGIRGIQRGLLPGYFYQSLLNGTRMGLYEPLRNLFKESLPDTPAFRTASMVTSGLLSGVLGAFIASPFFLVKTRMQSFSSSASGVGTQHSYVTKGTIHTLKRIYQTGGIRGLWRGSDARFDLEL
jgi:hypothetical protein